MAEKKFLDYAGLQTLVTKIKDANTAVKLASEIAVKTVETPAEGFVAQYQIYQGKDAEGNTTGSAISTISIPKAKESVVTVEKQTTAEDGFAATYYVKQDGTKVGDSINIPKDFLVKSGSVKVCEVTDVPVAGYAVGDKYLDFVVNATDGTGTDSHIYIKVTDLVDVYTEAENATEVQVSISDANVVSASLVDGGVSYDKLNADVKAKIGATNGAMVFKGTLENIPTTGSVGDTYIVSADGKVYTCTATNEFLAVAYATSYFAVVTTTEIEDLFK